MAITAQIVVNRTTNPTQFPQDPVFYLHQPYPSLGSPLPNRSPTQANLQGIGYIAPDSNRTGYAQNYNLGVQYELPANFVLEVGYIGNKGTRLEANGLDNLNQLPVSALRLGDDLIQPLSSRPDLAPLPFPGFTGTVAQALRPYPQYGNITQVFSNFGTSHYDSLQVQVTRHLTQGLAVLGAYTYSKAIFTGAESAIDAAGSQDVYNRRLERTIAVFNVPHFVKLTWIYELPFGKGRRWLNEGILSSIFGGWGADGNSPVPLGQPALDNRCRPSHSALQRHHPARLDSGRAGRAQQRRRRADQRHWRAIFEPGRLRPCSAYRQQYPVAAWHGAAAAAERARPGDLQRRLWAGEEVCRSMRPWTSSCAQTSSTPLIAAGAVTR